MQFTRRNVFSFAAVLLVLASHSLSADEIDRHSTKTPLRGSITAEIATALTIRVTHAGKTEDVEVPLGDVADVKYDGAAGLAIRTAASMERAGQFDKAIEAYQKAGAAANDQGFVARAAEFGKARALAKIALQDSTRLDDAIKAVEGFRSKHSNSRFHFALHDLLGQLQMEKGNDSAAALAFRELATAPIGEVKLKASLGEGRLLMKAGNFADAQARFDEVIAANTKGPAEKLRQQEAFLAKGDCLVKQKKFDEATALFRKVIDEVSPEESELLAVTCNALGDVLREAGKPKEALLAYLEVELLFSTQKAAHARAIYYMAAVWDQVGRADNAAQSREKLKRLYPDSSWVRQLPKP